MPTWKIHTTYAELIQIPRELAEAINQIIDENEPHDYGRKDIHYTHYFSFRLYDLCNTWFYHSNWQDYLDLLQKARKEEVENKLKAFRFHLKIDNLNELSKRYSEKEVRKAFYLHHALDSLVNELLPYAKLLNLNIKIEDLLPIVESDLKAISQKIQARYYEKKKLDFLSLDDEVLSEILKILPRVMNDKKIGTYVNRIVKKYNEGVKIPKYMMRSFMRGDEKALILYYADKIIHDNKLPAWYRIVLKLNVIDFDKSMNATRLFLIDVLERRINMKFIHDFSLFKQLPPHVLKSIENDLIEHLKRYPY